MVRGVSQNFLDIARREQRLARRTALTAALVAPLAGFLSDLADPGAYGPFWMLFVGAVVVGLAAGFLWTRRRLTRLQDDLLLQWNHWMRGAVGASSIAQVERKVHDLDPPPAWLGGAFAAGLLLLNVLLFALLWADLAIADPLALGVVLIDGVALGGLVASSGLVSRWARNFERSAQDLVRDGELTMWGER